MLGVREDLAREPEERTPVILSRDELLHAVFLAQRQRLARCPFELHRRIHLSYSVAARAEPRFEEDRQRELPEHFGDLFR